MFIQFISQSLSPTEMQSDLNLKDHQKILIPERQRSTSKIEELKRLFKFFYSSFIIFNIFKEDRRVNYVIKWNSNQEQLRKAKRANPRINLKSNPTSVFQYIPGNSSTRR